MIIKRIDLFMPPSDQHDILKYYTKKLQEAFIRLGVDCRILEAERLNPLPFLMQLFNEAPDCTLSFNGLLPDEEGRFFADLVKIPHVALLVNSPHHFFSLVNSKYNIIATSDRFALSLFKGMGHKNSLFLPHGIEPIFPLTSENNFKHDILFINGAIDYEQMEKKWKKSYPASIYNALLAAAASTLKVSSLSFMQALTDAINEANANQEWDREKFNLTLLLDELETYLLMKNNLLIAKELKGCRIHAIGNEYTQDQWQHYLGKNHCQLTVSEKSSFKHIIEEIKASKIAINSAPALKDGTNDYLFPTMASNAVMMTNENLYLQEHFCNEEEILFYNTHRLDTIKGRIEALLQDESKRQKMASEARYITLHHHTWDHRAASLLKELSPIIAHIKQTSLV